MRPIMTWVTGVLSGAGVPMAAWAQQRPSDYWGIHPFWGAWGIGMMLKGRYAKLKIKRPPGPYPTPEGV